MPPTDSFVSGFRYRGFIVERSRPIPELGCRLIELRHEESCARVMHVQAEDKENLFCLSFQTLPKSSNGVAHVLEHMVLCGSKKYPVKDPFFSMTRRSLNTFMNALTGTDFTCYPAATQIEKDFYNLLDVYLDAVFHPILSEESFAQEAHRLEFSSSEKNEELVINGVVYNEMKGAFAVPTRRLMGEMTKKMFPDTPYGYDSGGDPEEIPSLTLQQLKEFHATYYHPSRCLFFFYGDLPLAGHLSFIDERVLGQTRPLPSLPPPPMQKRHSAPIFSKIEYPITETSQDKSCYLSIGWLTTPLQNQVECLALAVLDIVLMDTDASALKHRLLQSGLCRQAASACDLEIAEVPYLITITGCEEKNAAELTEFVFSSLRDIAADGIPEEQIQHALHQLEFAKSEITGGGAPFGLTLFFRAALLAQHHIDPARGMQIHALFEELRSVLSRDKSYFSHLIQKYLLDNTHVIRVLMTPSEKLAAQETAKEQALLKRLEGQLSSETREKIAEHAKTMQETVQQDLSCLPSLHVKDVSSHCRTLHLSQEEHGTIQLFCHEAFTNGICYLDFVSPLPKIHPEDLWLARLICVLLPQLGCKDRDYRQTLEYLQEHTGGVYASLSISPQASNPESVVPLVHIKGKALERNIGRLIDILSDFLQAPRFDDRTRIKMVIEKHATDVEHAISHTAMEYASLRSSSHLSISSAISEYWYGISYLKNLRHLVKNYDALESHFLQKIELLAKAMLLNRNVHCVVSAGAEQLLALEHHMEEITALLPHTGIPWESPSCLPTPSHDQGFIISSHVGFTSLSKTTAPYIDPDTPVLSVAVQLLNNLFLHKRIREQGGAYGGGASVHPITGTCCFYSYKDPNIRSTIQGYEESIAFLQHTPITQQELEEGKLGVLQDLDSPIAPGGRGSTAYSWWRQGRTEQMRQRFREKVMGATVEEIQAALTRFFPSGWSEQSFVAIGGGPLLEKEQKKLVATGRQLNIEPL